MEVFNRKTFHHWVALAITICLGLTHTQSTLAQNDLRIKDICRLKGQEENTLQGMGLVVGLKGTGDGGDIKPTIRALMRAMQVMGGQVSSDIQGKLLEKEMTNSKNVALVMVEVTIPASGAQQGDRLNCKVSAISAKSLEGGNLMLTLLLGPRADIQTVYALASGPIVIDSPKLPTTGKIVNGCKMEYTVTNEFIAGNKFTLIVNPAHRSISTSQNIEFRINEYQNSLDEASNTKSQSTSYGKPDAKKIARAIDQTTIEVTIPPGYKDDPVAFVSMMLDLKLLNLHNKKRVFIDEREGVLIIGDDVTIAPVAISHKNLTISTRAGGGGATAGGSFVPVSSQDGSTPRPTLKNLTDALNVLAVPTADQIAIIKALKDHGNLYGELVIQ